MTLDPTSGRRRPRRSEAGAALLLISIIMVIVLVGGLAAVAVTTGEIASSRGYRTRQVTNACADATLEKIRANMPDVTAARAVAQSIAVGPTANITGAAGHYAGGTPQLSVDALPDGTFDLSATWAGQNIANQMSYGSSTGGDLSVGVHVLAATAVCQGSGFGAREMEVIFRYGDPMSAR